MKYEKAGILFIISEIMAWDYEAPSGIFCGEPGGRFAKGY